MNGRDPCLRTEVIKWSKWGKVTCYSEFHLLSVDLSKTTTASELRTCRNIRKNTNQWNCNKSREKAILYIYFEHQDMKGSLRIFYNNGWANTYVSTVVCLQFFSKFTGCNTDFLPLSDETTLYRQHATVCKLSWSRKEKEDPEFVTGDW